MQTAHSTISRETHFQKGNRLSGSPLRNVLVTQSCPTLCDLMEPARLLCPWNSPGKSTGVGCHFLLQGIFPTQGSNPGLLHCGQILSHLSHQGSTLFPQKYITIKKKQAGMYGTSQDCYGASLVAQRLKRLPAMRETRVRSLGREEP